jgi:DNA-directed RNA polymerase specialized sigma24 family protein
MSEREQNEQILKMRWVIGWWMKHYCPKAWLRVHDADDLTQMAWVLVVQAARRWEPGKTSLGTWCCTYVKLGMMWLAGRQGRLMTKLKGREYPQIDFVGLIELDEHNNFFDNYFAVEDRPRYEPNRAVTRMLHHLDAIPDADVVRRCHGIGRPKELQASVAADMGVDCSRIYQRVERALRRLAEALEADALTGEDFAE